MSYAADASRVVSGSASKPGTERQSENRRPASFSLPRERRLRRPADFQAVRNSGRSWSSALLVIRIRQNGLGVTRLGFSVSKRVGKAVARNKVKRRLREYIRQTRLQPGWDIVVIARPATVQASYERLALEGRELLTKAGLIMPQASGDNC
ncbi:MAG: ribonuclease P protein component [Chloroflexi bacterium]|nr:ribonuclease P protein component [Chloroflexota bacterium]